jgi:WD40 repeat protein
MTQNPFPGPQPYRATDRERFFGREDMSYLLQRSILANRCVTVYGPSGAGKSSLLQAAVFPVLLEKHDVRLIRVDAWPEGEEPIRWLANSIHAEMSLAELNGEMDAKEAIFRAAKGAARSSSRLLVIYLDQLEQLLSSGRTAEETQTFFDCTEELLDLPLRNVRVVLSLREDYLGRFRDRLRDLPRITESGLRVGPMSVAELTEAVVSAAAAGEPVQEWSPEEMRQLMLQVRVPGQSAMDNAEAQSAYAQIICRALFQERAAGKTVDATEAELILQRYFASTLDALGVLRDRAQQLLEEQLVGADGSRTLRTEKELARFADPQDIARILKQLEGAAILRAEEHHGNRYFEIGHDWLARQVFEQRIERERLAEQKRIEEEQARQLALAKVQQRRLRRLVALSVGITGIIGVAGVFALIARSRALIAQQRAESAEARAIEEETKAKWERDEANDLRIMAGYRALKSEGSLYALNLLAEVNKPEERSGWIEDANAALQDSRLFVTLRGHTATLRSAAYSPDGHYVLTASDDWTARIWRADGTGNSIVLKGHLGAVTSATFSPKSTVETLRALTTSSDGTARIWTIRGNEITLLELPGKTTEVNAGFWSPDGQRVAVISRLVDTAPPEKESHWVRIYSAKDGTLLGEHDTHKEQINAVVFLDDTHVVTASDDGNMLIWDGVTKGKITSVTGHRGAVTSVTVNRERGVLVSTSSDKTARVFKMGSNASLSPYATLEGHTGEVLHAAIRADGKFVATASADKTARVWNIEQPPKKDTEVILDKHDGPVGAVTFRPGKPDIVATVTDTGVRVFRVSAPRESEFAIHGQSNVHRFMTWSSTGDYLLTPGGDLARLWDIRRFDKTDPWLIAKHEPARTIQMANIAAKGEMFVAAYDDSSVERLVRDKPSETIRIKAPTTQAWGMVSAAASTADGRRLAIASLGADGTNAKRLRLLGQMGTPVRALHVYEGDKPIQQFPVESAIRHVAWDHSGERVVAAAENGTAMVFRVGDSEAPMVLQGHKSWVTSASFSADGQTILTTSLDKTVQAFDAKGALAARFEHPAPVYAAAMDPEGKRIATAAEDGVLRIFDSLTKEKRSEFDPEIGPLQYIAWSADGTRIAAASSRKKVVVWSDRTKTFANDARRSVLELDAPILTLAFVDAGSTLVAPAAEHTFAWNLDVAQLQKELSTRNRECVEVNSRVLYLNETPSVAERTFEACEKQYGRGPSGQPNPTSAMDSAIAARLTIWPRTTQVSIDGGPLLPRDGFFEVRGNIGDKKKVRLTEGAFSTEIEVTIEPSGANPSVLDLDDYRPTSSHKKKERTLDDIDVDAMVPEFKL